MTMIGAGRTVRALCAAVGLLAGLILAAQPSGAAEGPAAGTSIVGGKDTNVRKWPWQAALLVKRSAAPKLSVRERFFCGGTLIAPDLVLTAAHCAMLPDFLGSESFEVVLGRSKLTGKGGETIPVRRSHVPLSESGVPKYLALGIVYDVAILQLERPSAQAPISLAGPGEQALWRHGSAGYQTGWGVADSDAELPNDHLKVSRVVVQPEDVCGAPRRDDPLISKLIVCLGSPTISSNTCSGDSGGPFVVPIRGGGFRLVGLTSFGSGSCRESTPSGDALVAAASMRRWVRQKSLELSAHDPVGTGASALRRPRHCRVPEVRRKSRSAVRRALRRNGCGRPIFRTVRFGFTRKPRALWSNPRSGWLLSRGHRVKVTMSKPGRGRRDRIPVIPVPDLD